MSFARRLRTAVLFLVMSGGIAFAAGEVLSRAFPEHAILAEESGENARQSAHR